MPSGAKPPVLVHNDRGGGGGRRLDRGRRRSARTGAAPSGRPRRPFGAGAFCTGVILLVALPLFIVQNVFLSFFIAAEKPQVGFAVTVAAGVTNIVLD